MKKQLLNSAIFRLLEKLINIGVVLILTPFFIRVLGQEQYGLWILIVTAIGWFNFIDMGFSAAIQREIAIAIEKKSPQRINAMFSCSCVLFSLLGSIAVSCVLLIACFPEWIGVSQQYQYTASVAIGVLCLKVFWDFMMHAYHGFYSGTLRQDIDAIISTGNTLFKSVCIYYLVSDYQIYGAVAATMLSDVIFHSLKVYWAGKICPGFRFQWALVSKQELLRIFSYSKHVAANAIAKTIDKGIDPLVIAKLMSLDKVAIYSVANRLSTHVNAIIGAFLGFSLPIFSRLLVRKDNIEHEFNLMVSLSFALTIAVIMPLAILAQWFLYLWLGDSFEQAAKLVIILGFTSLAACIGHQVAPLLMAAAKHKMMTLASLTGAILNLLLSVVLGYHFDLLGVACATLIAATINLVFIHLLMLKHYLHYSVMVHIKRYLIANVLLILAVIAAQQGYQQQWHYLFGWWGFIACAIISFTIACVLAYFLLLDKQLRTMAKDYFGKQLKMRLNASK